MRVVLLTAFLLITGFISIALKAFLFLKPENFTREILVSNERGDNGYIRGLNNRNRGYNVIPPMEKRKTSVPCWTRVIRRLNTVLRAITLETGLNFFFYHGIAFTRSVSHVASGVNLTLTFHNGNQHCKLSKICVHFSFSHLKDSYGDNDCKYHWGDDMGGLLQGSLPYDLVEGDVITGKFLIDDVTPLTFTCNVCGRPCTIKVPVIDQMLEVDTPMCPIEKDKVHHVIGKLLPDKVFIPETIIKGTLTAVRADGVTVLLTAETEINVHW